VTKLNLMYKNQSVTFVIQHSVCFLYMIHKWYDTFLRLSQYFLYIYHRYVGFFMRASQVPSNATLHLSPANQHLSRIANNWPVFLREGYLKHVKHISFTDQNIHIVLFCY
jgi:hypothetical protein